METSAAPPAPPPSVFIPGSDWLAPSTAVILDALHTTGDALPASLSRALDVSRMSGSVAIDPCDADLFDTDPVRGPPSRPHVVQCRGCRRPVLITRFTCHLAVCAGPRRAAVREAREKAACGEGGGGKDAALVVLQLPPLPDELILGRRREAAGEVEGGDGMDGDKGTCMSGGCGGGEEAVVVDARLPYFDGVSAGREESELVPLTRKRKSRGLATARRLRRPLPANGVWGAEAAALPPAAKRRKLTASERSLAAKNASATAAAAVEMEESDRKYGPDPMRVFLQTGARNLRWALLMQMSMSAYQPRSARRYNITPSGISNSAAGIVVGVSGEKTVAAENPNSAHQLQSQQAAAAAAASTASLRQQSATAQMPTLCNAMSWLKSRSERSGPPLTVAMMETSSTPAGRPTPMFHGQTFFAPPGTYATDGRTAESIVLPLSHTGSSGLAPAPQDQFPTQTGGQQLPVPPGVVGQAGRPHDTPQRANPPANPPAAAAATFANGRQARNGGGNVLPAGQRAQAGQGSPQPQSLPQSQAIQAAQARAQSQAHLLGQTQPAQGHAQSPSQVHAQLLQAQAYAQALQASQGGAWTVPSTPKRRGRQPKSSPKGAAASHPGGTASPATSGMVLNPSGSASSVGQKRRASGQPGTPGTPKTAKVGPIGTPNSLHTVPSLGPVGGVGVPAGFTGNMELSASASQKGRGVASKGRKKAKSGGGANSSSSAGIAQAAAQAAVAAVVTSGTGSAQNTNSAYNHSSNNASSGRSTGRSAAKDGNGNASAAAAAAAAAAIAVAGAKVSNNPMSMSQAQALLSVHAAGRAGAAANNAQFQTPVQAAAKAALGDFRNSGATGGQPANFQQMMTDYLEQNASAIDPAKMRAAQQSAAVGGVPGTPTSQQQHKALQQQQILRQQSQGYQQLLQLQQRNAANLPGAGSNFNGLLGVQNALQHGVSSNLSQAQQEARVGIAQNATGANDPAQIQRRIAMQQNVANSQSPVGAAQNANVTDAQLMRRMAMQHQNLGTAQAGAGSNRQTYENVANLRGMLQNVSTANLTPQQIQQHLSTANLTPQQIQQHLQHRAQAQQPAQNQVRAQAHQNAQAQAINSLNSNARVGTGGGGSGGNAHNLGMSGISPQMLQLQAGNIGTTAYPGGRVMSNDDVLQSILQPPDQRLKSVPAPGGVGSGGGPAEGGDVGVSQSPAGVGVPPSHLQHSPVGSVPSPSARQPVAPSEIPVNQGLLDELDRALGGAPMGPAAGSSFANSSSGANFGEDDLGL